MSTFLLVVLAVVVGLALVAVGGYYWLRRKVRRHIGDYRLLAPYLIAPSARIKLRAEPLSFDPDGGDADHASAMGELRALSTALDAQGFDKLGTFAADEDGRVMIAAQHRDSGVLAQVIYIAGAPPYLECLTLSAAGQVRIVSGDPEASALQMPSMTVELHPALTASGALKALGAAPGRAIDTPTMVMLAERIHAARMDSRLVSPPDMSDTMVHGKRRGGEPLAEAQLTRALEMNRESWTDAVRIALLDNGRRKLKLAPAIWERLENNLIVVHEAMSADEVIATLGDIELVEKLGEQLKRQNFTPVQIFDEINLRLDAGQRRHLVGNVRFPVRARLFARAGAMRAAGLATEERAA